jgi:hypothetical protein
MEDDYLIILYTEKTRRRITPIIRTWVILNLLTSEHRGYHRSCA